MGTRFWGLRVLHARHVTAPALGPLEASRQPAPAGGRWRRWRWGCRHRLLLTLLLRSQTCSQGSNHSKRSISAPSHCGTSCLGAQREADAAVPGPGRCLRVPSLTSGA